MINNYKELDREIEMHVNMKEGFEASLKYWIKIFHNGCPKELSCQQYSDMPKGSRNDAPLDEVLRYIQYYQHLVEIETDIIKVLTEKLERINVLIKDSDNIYNKVAYLKYQKDEYGRKKYTLEQIAEMLVYSVDRIKQISAQV